MKSTLTGMLFLAALITFTGCSNVGSNFDVNLAQQIQKGKTTQAEIQNMFGNPYKTGVQNAHPAWVFEYDQYRAIGADASKDLIVVFNDDKTVRSYQIMSTLDQDGGSGSSSGHAGGMGSGSGSSSDLARGTGLNNYNCGSCSTTYKK